MRGMAQIEVQAQEKPDHYACRVTVIEGRSKTEHQVTVSKEDYRQLAGDMVSPEQLVEASFRFLLERESKESILRSFDLTVIGRYFPEYERTIQERLGRSAD